MVDTLSGLVDVWGDDKELIARVQKAVEWIASTPEGLVALHEAYDLHGKPLTIFVSSKASAIGYGLHDKNIILANPLISDNTFFKGQHGEKIDCSLERFLAHELKHATQPHMLGHDALKKRLPEIIHSYLTQSIPFYQYMHRIKASVSDEAKLKEIFGEMFDAHIGSNIGTLTSHIEREGSKDEVIQNYVREFEVPAIEFENLIMKYNNEPERSTDYLNSGIYEQLLNNEAVNILNRDVFIEGAISSLFASIKQNSASKDNFNSK
ncbi:hypothetical protein F9K33_07935 [bacterium]|nr:MAG: hypothetical protein F9K33_07935 [bacterium]